MAVGVLVIVHYPRSDDASVTTGVDSPPWDAVEESIRQLDGHHYPYIWLFSTEVCDEPDFAILGGNGAYVIYAPGEDGTLKFHDPSRGHEPVTVWTSDQGASFPACDVCPDEETVLSIARHFFETGQALATVPWAPVE